MCHSICAMFITFSEEFGIPVLWDACTQSVERHAQQLRHSQQWVEYPQAACTRVQRFTSRRNLVSSQLQINSKNTDARCLWRRLELLFPTISLFLIMLSSTPLLRGYTFSIENPDESESSLCPTSSRLMQTTMAVPKIFRSSTVVVLAGTLVGIGMALDHNGTGIGMIGTGVGLWALGTSVNLCGSANSKEACWSTTKSALKGIVGFVAGIFANCSLPLPVRCAIASTPVLIAFSKEVVKPALCASNARYVTNRAQQQSDEENRVEHKGDLIIAVQSRSNPISPLARPLTTNDPQKLTSRAISAAVTQFPEVISDLISTYHTCDPYAAIARRLACQPLVYKKILWHLKVINPQARAAMIYCLTEIDCAPAVKLKILRNYLRSTSMIKFYVSELNILLDEIRSSGKQIHLNGIKFPYEMISLFSGVKLDYVNFSESTFSACTFRAVSLKHADFTGARFIRSQLHTVNLTGAIFHNTVLVDTDFDTSILNDVDFTDARLFDTRFTNTAVNRIVTNNYYLSLRWKKVESCLFSHAHFEYERVGTVPDMYR